MSNAADPHLVRVEKGEASAEELAAVTALLLARSTTSPDAGTVGAAGHGPVRRPRPGWRRLERTPGFRAPHSWQG